MIFIKHLIVNSSIYYIDLFLSQINFDVFMFLFICLIISKIFGLSMEIVTNQLMARALDYNRSLPFPVVWLKCCGFTNLFLSNFRVGQCKYLKPSKNTHEMPEIRASHDWEQVKLQHCSQTTGKGKLFTPGLSGF
jgi:hypothetical protein